MKKKIKDLTRSEFRRWLERHRACTSGMKTVNLFLGLCITPRQAWNRCTSYSYLLWAADKISPALYLKVDIYYSCSEAKANIPFPGEYEVEI